MLALSWTLALRVLRTFLLLDLFWAPLFEYYVSPMSGRLVRLHQALEMEKTHHERALKVKKRQGKLLSKAKKRADKCEVTILDRAIRERRRQANTLRLQEDAALQRLQQQERTIQGITSELSELRRFHENSLMGMEDWNVDIIQQDKSVGGASPASLPEGLEGKPIRDGECIARQDDKGVGDASPASLPEGLERKPIHDVITTDSPSGSSGNISSPPGCLHRCSVAASSLSKNPDKDGGAESLTAGKKPPPQKWVSKRVRMLQEAASASPDPATAPQDGDA